MNWRLLSCWNSFTAATLSWQEHHTIGNPRQPTIPALGNLPPFTANAGKSLKAAVSNLTRKSFLKTREAVKKQSSSCNKKGVLHREYSFSEKEMVKPVPSQPAKLNAWRTDNACGLQDDRAFYVPSCGNHGSEDRIHEAGNGKLHQPEREHGRSPCEWLPPVREYRRPW